MSPDPIGRGWVPPTLGDRRRAGLSLLLGIALVLSPLWGGAVADAVLPTTSYWYDAVELETEDGQIEPNATQYETFRHGRTDLDRIACVGTETYVCGLEHGISDRTVSVPGWYADPPEPYVQLDRVYERQYVEGENSTASVSFEPVDPEIALSAVAASESNLAEPIRRTIAEGPVTTRNRHFVDGRVIATEDGYVAVFEREIRHEYDELPPAQLVYGVAILLGFILLRDGQRHYDRWREQTAP